MYRSGLSIVALFLLILPESAHAFGWRSRSTSTPSYYYVPAPVIAVPYATTPPPLAQPPLPQTIAPPLADPRPAPPSATPSLPQQTNPPPLAPRVSEILTPAPMPASPVRSNSYKRSDSCSVAFWNLSSRDLSIVVEGRTIRLPRGSRELLDLQRRFTWRIEGREPIDERVAAGRSALDLVIR